MEPRSQKSTFSEIPPSFSPLAATEIQAVRSAARDAAENRYATGPGAGKPASGNSSGKPPRLGKRKRTRVEDGASDSGSVEEPARRRARHLRSAYISRYTAQAYDELLRKRYEEAVREEKLLKEMKRQMTQRIDAVERLARARGLLPEAAPLETGSVAADGEAVAEAGNEDGRCGVFFVDDKGAKFGDVDWGCLFPVPELPFDIGLLGSTLSA